MMQTSPPAFTLLLSSAPKTAVNIVERIMSRYANLAKKDLLLNIKSSILNGFWTYIRLDVFFKELFSLRLE